MECNCEILNITYGTDISLKVTLTRGGEAFPVELSEQVAVAMVSERGERVAVDFTVGDEGRLLVTLRSDDFRTGRYGLEVVGVLNGAKWRAFSQSVVRYTFETVKGAERVAVQGDEYDVTLDVGLVSDIVPKRTSELLNDGEDGNDPFAKVGDVVEVLKHYAPLDSPIFTGIPRVPNRRPTETGYGPSSGTGIVASEFTVDNIINYRKGATNGIASLGNDGKVPVAQIPDLPYIPSNKKGAANGVAELDANRKVFNDQLYFAPRGTTTAAAMDGELDAGLYLVNGFKVSDDVLDGDAANGFLLQGTGASRGQLLVVGRAADAAAGEQVEIYTRRYLPTPKRWTAWSKGAGGGGSDTFLVRFSLQGTNTLVSDKSYQEIQEAVRAGKMVYAIYDDAVYILGYCQGGSATFYLSSDRYVVTYSLQIDSTVLTRGEYILPDAMSQAEAEAGSVTVSRVISPSVLKGAILYHTSDLVNGGAYNSTSKKIELKHGSTVVAEIDAAPFIVDGMVEDVRIENGNLVIDFNTESGKQDIAIPLTDIFDPSNYYTKQQTDGLLAGKASTADVSALQQQVAGKQDTISDLSTIRQNAAAVVTKEKKTTIVVATNTADPSQPVTSVFCNLSTYYRIPVPIESLTLMLPPNPQSGYVENIVVYLTGGTAPAVTIRSGDINPSPIYYHDGYAIESGNTYELNILWNGAAWVVASVEIVINN